MWKEILCRLVPAIILSVPVLGILIITWITNPLRRYLEEGGCDKTQSMGQ